MHPVEDPRSRSAPNLRLQLRIMRALMGALVVAGVLLTVGYFVGFGESGTTVTTEPPAAADVGEATAATTATTAPTAPATTSPSTTSPTTSTSTTTTTVPVGTPPHAGRYLVPDTEAEPEAKQLAADIAYALTTYEDSSDPEGRLAVIASGTDLTLLLETAEPLTYRGLWSRGEIVYPQLGGLTDDKASVMVVTRQRIGSGMDEALSVVRTIDIRLVRGEFGWEFESLASAGGAFETLEGLRLAHAVADDPRIEMPDSARIDILAGNISPILLELMADLAEETPYSVTVMATGHPYHVFETDRVSHHTLGRAIDIYRIGDRLVVDDRDGASATRTVVEWLYDRTDVIQIGSPWNIDGAESQRSFADAVHQDHIHLAVVEES